MICRHLFAAVVLLLWSFPGLAGTLETTAFTLDVPEAWQVERHGEEMLLHATTDSTILLSPATLKEDLPSTEREERLEFMRKAALYAMATVASNKDLTTVVPLQDRVREDGTRIYSTVLTNKQGTHFLVQCVVVGTRTVLLIEYDGPGDPQKALNTITQMVDTLEWR